MASAVQKFNNAIYEALIADNGAGGLVELTQDDVANNDPHIGRTLPQTKPILPFLGYAIRQSVPFVAEAFTRLQIATVEFKAESEKDPLVAESILDRLEELLHQNVASTNIAYYDISNADIRNLMTVFVSRDQPDFDQETDSWENTIVATLVWIDQPCS